MARSGILIGLGICALLCGVVLAVLTAAGATQIVAGKQILFLNRMRYDPHEDAKLQYEALHRWTEHVLRQRIRQERSFDYTLGGAFVVVGLLLIAWTVDRERLRRRIRKGSMT
jgi:hypothetical protein